MGLNVAVYLLITWPLSGQPIDPQDPVLVDYLRHLSPSLPTWGELRNLLHSLSAYDLFTFAHGYKPGAPETMDLFASMFLHGGFLHLAGNMLFLWIFGDNAEHHLGRIVYLISYLFSGVLATLAFALFAGDSMVPLVGASGAISGVLGLYFFLFPRNKVKVFVVLFPFFFDVLLLPVRWVLGFFVLVDNLLPFLLNSESNVAYGAHLGGFLAGFGVAWLGEHLAWKWPWSEKRWRRGTFATKRKQKDAAASSPLLTVRRALEAGDRKGALAAILHIDRHEMARLDPGECVLLSDWLSKSGHTIGASTLLRRCLAVHPGSRDLARVYLALGLLRLNQGQPTAAYQHLQSVFDHQPDAETHALARQALSKIDTFRRR